MKLLSEILLSERVLVLGFSTESFVILELIQDFSFVAVQKLILQRKGPRYGKFCVR